MNLNSILTVINTSIKHPVISNNGYALDVFAPKDLFLIPGCYFSIHSGFILNIPEPYLGFMTNRLNAQNDLSFTAGEIVHPLYDKEITIHMKYTGLSNILIKKDEPLCQIILMTGLKLI